jgi:hypothetical protein
MRFGSLTRAAEKLDDLVAPADELGNEVLVDERPLIRLAGPLFLVLSVCMIPWTAFVAVVLPSRHLSAHYDLAWTGFDAMLFVALAATAYFALRRSRYLPIVAAAAGTLLFVDAWFDVLTSRHTDLIVAIGFAVFIELPLGALCWWLSLQTQVLAEKRIALLVPRRKGQAPSPR